MKKRTVSIIMAMAMTASSLTAVPAFAADYVTANEWYEVEAGEIDQEAADNTYASAYYGLWSRTYAQGQKIDKETKEILDPGIDKQYCFYTPESWVAAGSCVYVVVPDGYTAEEFANETTWMQVADNYGLKLPTPYWCGKFELNIFIKFLKAPQVFLRGNSERKYS